MRLKNISTLACVFAAAAMAQEKIDLATLHQIKDQAFQHSQVMETLFYLTDVNGPRITASPGFFGAADWVVQKMGEWGVAAHQEKWPFGRGWQFTHFSAHLIAPQYAPLIGYPQAWTGSTKGTVTGEPLYIEKLDTEADLEKYKGRLRDRIVLIGPERKLEMSTETLGHRYNAEELKGIQLAPDPSLGGRGEVFFSLTPQPPRGGGRGPGGRGFQQTLQKFLAEEQPAIVVRGGAGRSEGGDVFGGSAGSRDPKDAVVPATVVLTPEHYNRIVRLIEHKIPVKLEFNVQTKFQDARQDSVDVIAEIPGGAKRDEVVMFGAHLDSWQGATGATDNGAGSAVMIEAMRILKSLNVTMDRTVRMALWSGEEQGELGSRAYVKEHFGDPATMQLTAEHAKLAGYFNIDNGGGKIRGIYMQGNDQVRPIFKQWFAPLKDLTEGVLTIRNTGSTDHMAFDAVGLPGFQFVQDPMDYMTRTHHSNMDTYDRVQKPDMEQMSAIVASFVYDAAMRAEMLPRKPLPAPQGRGGRGGSN